MRPGVREHTALCAEMESNKRGSLPHHAHSQAMKDLPRSPGVFTTVHESSQSVNAIKKLGPKFSLRGHRSLCILQLREMGGIPVREMNRQIRPLLKVTSVVTHRFSSSCDIPHQLRPNFIFIKKSIETTCHESIDFGFSACYERWSIATKEVVPSTG